MADTDTNPAETRDQFFDELGDLKAGMLRIEGSSQHAQPMSHHIDRDAGVLWFITSRETDLAREVGAGAKAHFTITGKGQDYWACAMGDLSQVEDRAKLDELWDVMAEAFFKGSKDNPEITLLKFDLRDAAIWASTGNPIVFGLEILRSQMDEDHVADIGSRDHISF